ncbi:MAG TPA: endolytic transglycosylase MltG [Negativicutes bacterium]|jgi:UPF0755 protein
MQYKAVTGKWLVVVTLVSIFFGGIVYGLAKPVVSNAKDAIIITVKPGMAADDIGTLLYQQGIINNPFIFHMVARMQGMENSLKAGDYALTPDMTVPKIVAILSKGDSAYRQLTIPEGYTIEQIANLLQEKQLGSAVNFKSAAKNFAPYEYMNASKPDVKYKAEGYVFPDTYRISRGITEEQLLSMLVMQFNKEFTPALQTRASEIGLTIREVVILASLVEKEAQLERDRPLIAGVFLNRLRKDMPLQSCATIQYILGYPKPELTVQDTEIDSAYNTYQHMGLPPGPIANPGMAAIQAVLFATDTDYLYFVADRQGAHHFSKTYEEHLATIEQVRG